MEGEQYSKQSWIILSPSIMETRSAIR